MHELSGEAKFNKCRRKGYRSCPQYNNLIMKNAILEDVPEVPEGSTLIMLKLPSSEDRARAFGLCESCDSFKLF